MPSKQPILTIGIPTWNRVRDLQDNICAWITEIESVDEEVEIVVSDNASDDETKNVLHALSSQIPFLRYFRNDTNLGPDLNFLEVFKRAAGQYVWLFSDDDFVAQGSLAEVLRIIRAHYPGYISTNFMACDNEGRIMKSQPRELSKYMVRKDILNADVDNVFSRRNHWLSFMSSNIFRLDLLDIAQYEANLALVRNWILVYVTAHVLSREPSGYLSSFYAVKWRLGNCPCESRVFAVAMPESFAFICDHFSINRRVRARLVRGIRSTVLPFWVYVSRESSHIEASPLIFPRYYKIARSVWLSRLLVRTAWKVRRFILGKGFSLP